MSPPRSKGIKRLLTMILNFVVRALRRLRLFPFTLGYMVMSAVVKGIELWRGDKLARLVRLTEKAANPAHVMVFFNRMNRGMPDQMFDLCLWMPADDDPALHDIFSMLLTLRGLRSVAFYWDDSGLADDLPLWQSRRERLSVERRAVAVCEGSADDYHAYFKGPRAAALLPVAAMREAGILLKRLVGGEKVVCLNLPEKSATMEDALAEACPELWFINLETGSRPSNRRPAKVLAIYGYGLSVHERLALVQAADAYVGCFDEYGCAALSFDRPTVLLEGSQWRAQANHPLRSENALWFPDAAEVEKSVEEVAEFLHGKLSEAEPA